MDLITIRAVREVVIPAGAGTKTGSTRTLREGETASVARDLARELFRRGAAVPDGLQHHNPLRQPTR